MLDPMAGNGRFIETIDDHYQRADMFQWTAVEVRPEEETTLRRLIGEPILGVHIGDFLAYAKALPTTPNHQFFDIAITNPSFAIAFDALLACLSFCRRVTFLQRRNWLGSEERADFFRTHMPDEQTLPNRPCFTLNERGKPATDSIEYSFFTFHGAEEPGGPIPLRPFGQSSILGSTSREERRTEIDELVAEYKLLHPDPDPVEPADDSSPEIS